MNKFSKIAIIAALLAVIIIVAMMKKAPSPQSAAPSDGSQDPQATPRLVDRDPTATNDPATQPSPTPAAKNGAT